jgi:hypothetical protein
MNKNLFTSLALGFALLITSATVFAQKKVLFISDIDDTIKPTHVHALDDVIQNAWSNKVFLGLNQLYLNMVCDHLVESQDFADCIRTKGESGSEHRSVHYVTGFPFFDIAKEYLQFNGFPRGGSVRSKPVWKDMFAFKLEQHLEIILDEQPDTIVLIGDNGQLDPAVFAEVTFQVQKLADNGLLEQIPEVHAFVHQVYDESSGGSALQDGQLPFLGLIDLCVQLNALGLLQSKRVSRLATMFSAGLKNPKSSAHSIFLPEWVECSDYYSWYKEGVSSDKDLFLNPNHRWFGLIEFNLYKFIAQFESLLSERCIQHKTTHLKLFYVPRPSV